MLNEMLFVRKLERILNKEGFLTRAEVNVGYGIADLVLIQKQKFQTKNIELRRGYGQTSQLLKEEYFRVLNFLPEVGSARKVDLNYIIERGKLSRSHLRYNIITNLKEKGFVKIVGGKYYFKVNGWLPLATEVIAIEAKLKNWRRGFIQANRYKSFAHTVYLAVPHKIKHVVNKDLLKEHGIGLMTLNTQTNKKEVILRPRKSTPLNPFKCNLATEHFWNHNTVRAILSS